MIRASVYNFVPDAALALQALGAVPITADFVSTPIALNKLTSYWSTSEWGINKRLRVLVGIKSPLPQSVDAFRFVLEVDSSEAFSSPTEVASVSLTAALVATGAFELSFDTDDLEYADPNATHMRLKVTGAGADTAFADITGFLGEGDGFTVDNGLLAGSQVTSTVLVGTNEVGSIAFSNTASPADAITINDGVNAAVQFTFVASGATGTQVNVGASAAESATNLAAVIQAQITAGNLDVSVVDNVAGTLTIKNLAAFSGLATSTITEDVDGGTVITVTDFAGGVSGISTQAMLEFQSLTYAAQIAEIASFLETDSSNEFLTRVSGDRVIITNTAATSASIGSITENQDTNASLAVTAFSLASDALSFWAYIRND